MRIVDMFRHRPAVTRCGAAGWPRHQPARDAAAVAAAQAMLGMAVRCEIPGGLGIPATFTVETGDPAEMLVKLSADAGLLVIGSRSSCPGGSLLDGHVVSHCLIHSSCPVDICADHRQAA